MRILILGASYGSLLSTKLLMAGHNVTLVCRQEEADLINKDGTHVRIKLKDESDHRTISSKDLAGTLDATTPDKADPSAYDLVGLAMQEPQYAAPEVKALLTKIGTSGKPCLSIMNMPPLPFLRRIGKLKDVELAECYRDSSVWDAFNPDMVSLCSPDPQAFRPPEEEANVLHVGLPTNFKASAFADAKHTALLKQLEDDIAAVRLDGKDVPVKLRVHDSLFVPMAKWAMLMCGNYRCIGADGIRSIHDAVYSDEAASKSVYDWVGDLTQKLGASASDQVPYEKYAAAAKQLLKPSSVARAIDAGAPHVERVDKLVAKIGKHIGMENQDLSTIASTVDKRLEANRK
ncbi:MAG: hypothetical protein MJE68_13505 [Proteobacteria bacterium]|nr:hypothetical protein [Pseudomonadota bacterium]